MPIKSEGIDSHKKDGPVVYKTPIATPKMSLPPQKVYKFLINVIDTPAIPIRFAISKVDLLPTLFMIGGAANEPIARPTDGIPVMMALYKSA